MLTNNPNRQVQSRKSPLIKRVKKKILYWMRLTNDPVIKVYNGFGNDKHLIVFGHVLSLSPMPRKKYTSNVLTNTFSLLRLFMVRPKGNARIRLTWNNEVHESHTEKDGFFRFELEPGKVLPGWHPLQVQLIAESGEQFASGDGLVFFPHEYQYAFISDIDDTFLISHSSKLRKRLYVLFTKNAHSRKPFEGVVNHYKLLSQAGVNKEGLPNPFFYVSSSEWNLYDYIRDFSIKNTMPQGIYLLSQLKRFKEVFKTGQNKHATKFMRIARVFESYPSQRYVLLGDDSQEDPNIYSAVATHFPEKVHAVYLRRVDRSREPIALAAIKKLEDAGIHCCYFTDSSEAILHSRKINLIV